MSDKPVTTVVVIKKKLLYLIVCVALFSFVQPIGFYVYVNSLDRSQNRDWCELITFYTDYYKANPPQSPLQQQQADLMKRRSESLNCS